MNDTGLPALDKRLRGVKTIALESSLLRSTHHPKVLEDYFERLKQASREFWSSLDMVKKGGSEAFEKYEKRGPKAGVETFWVMGQIQGQIESYLRVWKMQWTEVCPIFRGLLV